MVSGLSFTSERFNPESNDAERNDPEGGVCPGGCAQRGAVGGRLLTDAAFSPEDDPEDELITDALGSVGERDSGWWCCWWWWW